MPALLVPALIGGAATIAGSAISSHAANNAANTEAKAAADANALLEARYQDTRSLEMPYIQQGQQADGFISALLGLGGDPAKAQQAFSDYLGSTGYQFRLNSGADAIATNRAASGLLKSGGTLKALEGYGQNLGTAYFGDYLSQIGGVANRGATAVNALAGYGQTAAQQQGQNIQSAATTSANAGLVGASNTNSVINNALQAFAIGQGRSSYGGSGYTPFATDINGMAGLY